MVSRSVAEGFFSVGGGALDDPFGSDKKQETKERKRNGFPSVGETIGLPLGKRGNLFGRGLLRLRRNRDEVVYGIRRSAFSFSRAKASASGSANDRMGIVGHYS